MDYILKHNISNTKKNNNKKNRLDWISFVEAYLKTLSNNTNCVSIKNTIKNIYLSDVSENYVYIAFSIKHS